MSWLACLMTPLLSVAEFAPLSVSLQTLWVTGRLIFCMLAVGTTTCEQKGKKRTRSWDCDQILSHAVSKKGHEETCGMYDMTIKGLLAFLPFNCLPESFSHPFFFLLSSHGEHLSWCREDPRQVTCKRGQNQRAQCHTFSISFEVPLTLPIKWAHLIQLPL